MKQHYEDKNFRASSLKLIGQINDIIAEYERDGYVLTVRQLYYQLVAKAIIPNTQANYKKAAQLVNDAKLAGLIDWDMLEDRTRAFDTRSRWDSPQQILNSCADGYHMDMWDNQTYRVFCIVEKEALVGVLKRICDKYDVPLLAARGYPSGSVLREFGREDLMHCDQVPIILHLGDHDPSGIDMTRDLQGRIDMFAEQSVKLHRIALNMKQVEDQKPPENPAKPTDSRFEDYKRKFGSSSWELDALSPRFLDKMVTGHIRKYIDDGLWRVKKEEIEEARTKLTYIAENYDKIKTRNTLR